MLLMIIQELQPLTLLCTTEPLKQRCRPMALWGLLQDCESRLITQVKIRLPGRLVLQTCHPALTTLPCEQLTESHKSQNRKLLIFRYLHPLTEHPR